MDKEEAVKRYRVVRSNYVLLTDKVKHLLTELLKLNDVKFHLVDGRAKSIESFQEKIRRPNKSYKDPLNELTDLSGIRAIVYYHDDVAKVANVLSTEFDVVEKEISHQASEYNPEEFGYISLHYIVKINADRAILPEWKPYAGLLIEVQIRTVLQHSWASISHALQYKNESDVPRPLRRKLNRLAGLFELADEQFIDIRDESEKAREQASVDIQSGNHQIEITPISLREFASRWDKAEEVINYMLSVGFLMEDELGYDDEEDEEKDYFGPMSEHCGQLGINTINDFELALSFDYHSFLKSLRKSEKGHWYISVGFAIYLLLIRSKIESFTVEDLVLKGWGESTAEQVIHAATLDAQ